MKVVLPLEEKNGMASAMCEHFGSAPFFAVADSDTDAVVIIANPNSDHVHGQCTPADAFAGMGADAVICNGIGARAATKMQMVGIGVYLADGSPTLADALGRFKAGELVKVTAEQACQGHDCH
ncbi:NifB/NifX family molybdenum-iron cluster-binding protein [Chlorobium sp. N1]|uniref:NifB/NifX family molybdenum-iron cluster-binding protein n=1 Tax=Chlorobium sp. N1 TaxID=2491138 RepID=UPI00103AC308|nr:NifB/NifX family molybdenum-iron cluster-binding protein [Chlorobium sp. N1]TCD47137.1 dinitrogenase iron-molybdenum cofactor biosynthesis protein [Chlorobium sp. N1]